MTKIMLSLTGLIFADSVQFITFWRNASKLNPPSSLGVELRGSNKQQELA